MNTIKNVTRKNLVCYGKRNYIEVETDYGFVRVMDRTWADHFNLISSKEEVKCSDFKEYSSFSKDELESIQKYLLFAFVYLYDKLNEAIENSDSKNRLDGIKKNILETRLFLQNITKYIDDYGNLLKEYKDV